MTADGHVGEEVDKAVVRVMSEETTTTDIIRTVQEKMSGLELPELVVISPQGVELTDDDLLAQGFWDYNRQVKVTPKKTFFEARQDRLAAARRELKRSVSSVVVDDDGEMPPPTRGKFPDRRDSPIFRRSPKPLSLAARSRWIDPNMSSSASESDDGFPEVTFSNEATRPAPTSTIGRSSPVPATGPDLATWQKELQEKMEQGFKETLEKINEVAAARQPAQSSAAVATMDKMQLTYPRCPICYSQLSSACSVMPCCQQCACTDCLATWSRDSEDTDRCAICGTAPRHDFVQLKSLQEFLQSAKDSL